MDLAPNAILRQMKISVPAAYLRLADSWSCQLTSVFTVKTAVEYIGFPVFPT